jgi:cephalosporin hydroxylase
VPAQKSPTDFWIYQELIHRLQPDVIVEIGNYRGGSTLDVHFISSLPVVQRTVCKAWADTRPIQIAWAES